MAAYVSRSREGRQALRWLITNLNIFLSGSDEVLMGQRYPSIWGVKCQILIRGSTAWSEFARSDSVEDIFPASHV